jgi:pimeloyl-ACP methyl ester carboxylesterase
MFGDKLFGRAMEVSCLGHTAIQTLPKTGTGGVRNPYSPAMRARTARCRAVYVSLFTVLSLAVPAQNPAPPSTATPASAPSSDSNDAAYRKLDQVLSFIRERNAKDYAIDPAKGIDEASYVSIGSIEQWVTIRGQDRRNPVLLFLHGGPGDVTNPWSFAMFAPWEANFTVVQWDQRGAGRTLSKSGPSVAPTMTLDRMSQDGIELTEYLCKHLGKPKIILIAHSFGTVLGLSMIRQSPGLFFAYVGTGQVADETRNYAAAYDALLKKAQATGNQQALDELKSVGPPPYSSGRGYQVQRKWSNLFEGAYRFLYGTLGLALVAPGYSVQDLNDALDGQNLSGEHLVPQTRSETMKELGLEFAIPIFFFEGTEDFTTPTELARTYLEAIHAPKKEFVPIPGGHFSVFMNSDEFLKQLVAHVAPLAGKGTPVANSQSAHPALLFRRE